MKLYILAILLVPLLAISYANQVSAQRFAPGYCPTVTAHENFDKTKFFGNWIEVEKTPSIFDLMMRCLVVDYSDDQDNTVNVVVRGVSLAGLPLTVNGDGLLQDMHRSGFYSIRYGFGVPFQGTLTTIIDTDYDDYAVVYSCTNSLLSGVFHSEYIWVLSRSGKISNPTRQNIYEKLDKLQINRSGLTMSDRSTCPTNSSNVARESDKDLAGQGVSLPVNGNSAPSAADSSPASTPSANLEKTSGQQQQQQQEQPTKSVVVPLLYDQPTPVASKSNQAKSPPAPVENKIPQLPPTASLSSASPTSAKQTAKAQAQQQAAPAAAAAATPVGSQSAPAAQSAPVSAQAASQASSSSAPVQSGLANNKAAASQAPQQNLLSKIVPKQ